MKKSNIVNYLQLAAKISLPSNEFDQRNFWIGSVGIRTDKVLVYSKNSSVFTTDTGKNFKVIPTIHAEPRVLRKLNWGSIMFVSRVMRSTKKLGMARPCQVCQVLIKSKGIKKVFYSIDPETFGVWYPLKNEDKIFNMNFF